jgi:hypothetical protein
MGMGEIERALAEISDIRSRIAAGTEFRGFGPAALAATGGLALITATVQSFWQVGAAGLDFFLPWIATAVFCCGLIGAEMVVRTRRHHSGMADAMIHNAVQQFLPAGAAGAALAAVIGRFAPEATVMLPGLWQVFVALGIFAAAPSLPRGMVLAGAWYFVAGFTVLMIAAESYVLSPWMMGIPFALGQFLLAAILYRDAGSAHG